MPCYLQQISHGQSGYFVVAMLRVLCICDVSCICWIDQEGAELHNCSHLHVTYRHLYYVVKWKEVENWSMKKDLVIILVWWSPKINYSDIQKLLICVFYIGLSLLLCCQWIFLKEMLSVFSTARGTQAFS